MKDKDILEGKSVIAIFMDGELMPERKNNVYWFKDYHHVLTSHKAINIHAMKYHSSWDWLIPVCKKIRELTLTSDEFTQSMKLLWDIYEAMHDFDIQKVYPPVVSFCKWYNSHQK